MVTNTIALAASLFSLQWGLQNHGNPQKVAIDHYTSGFILGTSGEDIRLPQDHLLTKKPVVVAVLDTGIDSTHPQLKDALVKGINILDPSKEPVDVHGHGTHVAGIIAARPRYDGDFSGVSSTAMIMPVKVVQTGPNAPIRPQDLSGTSGTALTENVAKGLTYAIQNGAQVVNLSLAWPTSIHSAAVDAAMKLAQDHGVLIVSSAGNDGTRANVYPCTYENVICVGAHGPDGAFTYFSNYGSMVDVIAPGIDILSSWPMNKAPSVFAGQVGYEFKNGTSMAAPFVVGALAELLSRGYSPDEAKNRILLGSRVTATQNKYQSSLKGAFQQNFSSEPKYARFGNLDIANAISLRPSPLISPKRKALIELDWNGSDRKIDFSIDWINQWSAAGETVITVAGKSFHFKEIPQKGIVNTAVEIEIDPATQESSLSLPVSVSTSGFHRNYSLEVQITRVLRSDVIPAEASVSSISGIDPSAWTDVRSVVPSVRSAEYDLVFTRSTKDSVTLGLVKDGKFIRETELKDVIEDNLLNIYRLPDSTYAAISSYEARRGSKPGLAIHYLDQEFKLVSSVKVGTDITTISEHFQWMQLRDHFTPLWQARGLTPPLDAPAYDPFDPNYQDGPARRLYYLDGSDIRLIKMEKNELPLLVFPSGKVLVAKGNSYFAHYYVFTIHEGKITDREEIPLSTYRMLIGIEDADRVLNLDGSAPDTFTLSGPSTPGDLRVTAVGAQPFDQMLNRSSTLEALVATVGTFQGTENGARTQSFFVQTHYDLKFYSGSEVLSTTLNRYSYVPSMIFNRNFYPLVVKSGAEGRPGIYISATLANAGTSEMIFASHHQLKRPAKYRIQVQDDRCNALGNLIEATESAPAQEVFVCGTQLIRLPITE